MMNEDYLNKEKGWKLVINSPFKDGVSFSTYSRPFEGGGINLQRSDGKMTGVTVEAWEKMMCDPKNMKHKMVTKLEYVERSESESIIEERIKIPFLSEREIVFKMTSKRTPDGKLWISTESIEDARVPIKKDLIRMEFIKHIVCWMEGNDCHFTEFNRADMKGYVPVRLINMAMSSSATKAMKEVYKKLLDLS
jgi:hypothetical protein